MLTRLEIDQALRSLAGRRPVFHSEADFQHELAVEIRDLFQCKIRLEVPKAIQLNGAPTKAEIDLLVRTPQEDNWTAIELKYCKLAANLTHQGEQFALANSWGTNLSRFDCLADLMRVEAIVAAGHAKQGFAVFLTNAPVAWQTDVGVTANMASQFSIHEARAIPAGASLDWNPPDPPIGSVSAKRKAPYAPITIARAQTCRWTDFSDLRQANGTFRYLVLEGSASTKIRPADEAEQERIVFDAITSASMKIPPAYMALYRGQSEERVRGYFVEDAKRLKQIVDCAELAPQFRRHPQHCAACPDDSIFQIPYSAIMKGEFVICVNTEGWNPYWDAKYPTVLKRYDSAEALLGDGWLLA